TDRSTVGKILNLRPYLVHTNGSVRLSIEKPQVIPVIRAAKLQFPDMVGIHFLGDALDQLIGELWIALMILLPDAVDDVLTIRLGHLRVARDRVGGLVQLPLLAEPLEGFRLTAKLRFGHARLPLNRDRLLRKL